MKWCHLISVLLVATFSVSAHNYQTTVVADNLEFPWSLAQLPDGRFLVTERSGRLLIIDAEGDSDPVPVSGLPRDLWVEGQAGLFEVKVAPDFASSDSIFISYACGTASANTTCLARARLQNNALHDLDEIFRAAPSRQGSAHYGGRFLFLPDDTIVLGLGDGFDYREQAQQPENHIGSIVRIHQDGSIPADNPLVGLSQAAPETYSYGHRNVQGLAYDHSLDRLYSNEHGPRGGDEINLMQPGANYGWPLLTDGVDYTGARITPFKQLPGMMAPLHVWTPSVAPSSLSLYRGEEFSDWDGDFLVSTLAAKDVRRVRLRGSQVEQEERLFTELNQRIRYITQTADGALYLLTDDKNGQLIRITAD
ncbi:PQQ-dependent sugar dehydrogenase [Aliidiomarina sp. Khilg15.8]